VLNLQDAADNGVVGDGHIVLSEWRTH
jgi:hypothetical protein